MIGGKEFISSLARAGVVLMLLHGTTTAAEIKAMIPPPVQPSLNELIPQFERASGHKLTIVYEPSWLIMGRLQKGETADVVFLTAHASDEMIQKRLLAGRVDLARSTMGIATRAGAPTPDIGTVEKFKQTLLGARTFARNEGADSGVFMVGLLQRLGIFEEMKAKSTLIRQGHVAELVARGEVEMAAQQMSELMAIPGVVATPLPAEIQNVMVFCAAFPAASQQAGPVQQLITFLTSPAAAAAFKSKGLDPA
jgi:molybdate transport system substrate-binding protein